MSAYTYKEFVLFAYLLHSRKIKSRVSYLHSSVRNLSSSVKFLKLAKRSESLSWHLNFLLFVVDPKLYDTHELSLTQCSRQELSESTCISLITLPLRRRPLISLAKLTAWKTVVIIRGSPCVKKIVKDTRSNLSRYILRNLSLRCLGIFQY